MPKRKPAKFKFILNYQFILNYHKYGNGTKIKPTETKTMSKIQQIRNESVTEKALMIYAKYAL